MGRTVDVVHRRLPDLSLSTPPASSLANPRPLLPTDSAGVLVASVRPPPQAFVSAVPLWRTSSPVPRPHLTGWSYQLPLSLQAPTQVLLLPGWFLCPHHDTPSLFPVRHACVVSFMVIIKVHDTTL